jgi:hypothetical protein
MPEVYQSHETCKVQLRTGTEGEIRLQRQLCTKASLLRLVTAILVEIDEDWATTDCVYINMLDQND